MKNSQSISEIQRIHDAFDKKEFTPLELTQEYLGRIRASQLNAFLTVSEEKALEQARAATAVFAKAGRVPREAQPLFGIPFGVKDNMVTQGLRTTCGSRILENYIPPYSATVVNRVEKAGAVILGKLNMDEFAMGSSNENSAFGPVQHPTHPGHVPGGSSGGSACAVAAGLCVAALGSDTGGSIRLPASFCGVTGVKPTYGHVSRYGLVAFASSLDQIGPLTKSVHDSAVVLDVISGADPLDSTSLQQTPQKYAESLRAPIEWSKIRIGIPEEYFVSGVQAEVATSVQDAMKWFEKQGAKCVPVSLPHTSYAVSVYYVVAVSEASSNLARFDGVRFGVRPEALSSTQGDLLSFYKKVRSRFGDEVKRRIMLGTFALSSGYSDQYYRKACQVRRLIQQDFISAFEKVDFILGPVAPSTAFKLGEKSEDPLQMYLNDIFTIPANLAGLPALSVPCGRDWAGLPIGLHLAGKLHSDSDLLRVADAFERRA
ncbi:Asp-tRNA(Asn)/Glu-tRNA(Gln) amidotransferase subunit GatA [Bdellovibrionota bacterium FG-2]